MGGGGRAWTGKRRGHYGPILLCLLASRSERQTGETVAECRGALAVTFVELEPHRGQGKDPGRLLCLRLCRTCC